MELELNNNETKWKKQKNKNISKNNKNNSKNISKNNKNNSKNINKGFDNTTKSILSKPLQNIYEFEHYNIENTQQLLEEEYQENLNLEDETKGNNINTEGFSNSLDFADKELTNELNIVNAPLPTKNKTTSTPKPTSTPTPIPTPDEYCSGDSSNQTTKEVFGYLHYFFSILNYPSIYLDYFKEKIGIYTCEVLSQNKADDDDKHLVIKNMDNLLSLGISIFVLYNLFFIFSYKQNNIPIQTISISDQLEKILKSNSILNFLFEYVTYPISLLDIIFTKKIPYYINFLQPTIVWVFLFYIILYIVTNYGNYLTDLFYNSLTMITDSTKKPSDFGTGTSSIYPILQGLILIAAISGVKKYGSNINSGMLIIIGIALIILVQIAISQYLVTFAAISIAIYILLYSFFGISIYSNNPLFSTIKLINEFIHNSVKDKETTNCKISNDCKKTTFFQNIMEFIQLIINLIYKYIFIFTAISILIYSMFDYSINIKNTNLKNGLIILILVVILIIFIILYIQNLNNMQNILKFEKNNDVNSGGNIGGNNSFDTNSISGGNNYSHPLQSDEEFHLELNQLLEKQIRQKNIKNLFDKKNK